MQQRYWNFMTQCKFSLFYLNEHFQRFVKFDRVLNMILAITSSSAIATWAIWQKYSYIWACIIALSQVINVVNNNLPYKNRITSISDLKAELTGVYNEIEYNWYKVCNGLLREDEVNDLIYNYNKRWNVIDSKYFMKDSLPQSKKVIDLADKNKNQYFENFL